MPLKSINPSKYVVFTNWAKKKAFFFLLLVYSFCENRTLIFFKSEHLCGWKQDFPPATLLLSPSLNFRGGFSSLTPNPTPLPVTGWCLTCQHCHPPTSLKMTSTYSQWFVNTQAKKDGHRHTLTHTQTQTQTYTQTYTDKKNMYLYIYRAHSA